MTVEDTLYSTLGPAIGPSAAEKKRVYPLVAPPGAAKPYITFQQVGGKAINFVESAVPGLRNGVFQINCWATTNAAAKALAIAAEEALILAVALQTTVLGAAVVEFDEVAQLFGSRQDFSVWY